MNQATECSVLSNFDKGIVLINSTTVVSFWNHWLEVQTGIAQDDIIGKKLIDVFPEINVALLTRKIKTALTLKTPTFYNASNSKYLLKIELGSFSATNFEYMQQNVSIFPLDSGALVLVISDQTETLDKTMHLAQKMDEIKILNSSLVMEQNIVDQYVPIVKTKDGKVLSISHAICALPENSRGMYSFSDIFILMEEYSLEEYENIYKLDNFFYAEDKYFSVLSKQKSHENEQVFILEDVTSKLLLKEKQELLIFQSQHAAMGEMISMIAHQWRQPLAVIGSVVGKVQCAKELEILDDTTLDNSMTQIEKTVQFLSETISDFSNFFKPNREKQKIDIIKAIEKSLFFMQPAIKSNTIEVIKKYDAYKVLTVYESELVQVFINIVKNAVDEHTKKNTSTPFISISTQETSEYLVVEIVDNAGGIPKEIIKKVFLPYFSTKSKNGTGIGLYMSKTIVEEHHKGLLELDSTNGTTTFRVSLPLL